MKTKTIASLFVLSAIISIAVTVPSAYAGHADAAEVEMIVGSGMPGCEETLDCYSPSEVTIAVGGHVEWINNDISDTGLGMYHTVTSGTSPIFAGDGPDGTFDSSMIAAGDKFLFEFSDAGEYQYYCTMHPWMTGLVKVESDDHHAEEEAAEAEAAAAELAAEAEAAAADAAAAELAAAEAAEAELAAAEAAAAELAAAEAAEAAAAELAAAEAAEHAAMEHAAAEAAAAEIYPEDIVISVPDYADANEVVAIDVTIGDSHVTYDIIATHNGETILDETGVHVHGGEGSHETSALTAPASDDNPIDVTVTFQGFGMPGDDMTGPIGLTNTAQVVPEFGTIAAMILVVAIVSIIAITSKSKLSLAPRL